MTVRWSQSELESRRADLHPGLTVDDLHDAGMLVLDGVTADDDAALGWVERAPCVVVAIDDVGPPSNVADVALVGGDRDRLDAIERGVMARPQAASVLVDVLRTVADLDVVAGLRVESFAYSMLLAAGEFRDWLDSRPPATRHLFRHAAVRSEREAHDLRVTLARPQNRNAFSAELRDGLVEALAVAEADPTIERVVLDADGTVFSSGGDLTEFGTASDPAAAHRIRTLRSVGALLDRLGDRAEVRVHGTCVGAGVELPAFAARVVADPGATFRLPEVGMGLIPGAGGTVSVTRRIGRQATAELALTGRAMGAEEARSIGLVDEVRPLGAQEPR